MTTGLVLTPVSSALITPAPAGKLRYFSNSLNGEELYKIDDAGVVTPAISALANPMTTTGDIIYGVALGVPTRLGAGSNGQVLTLAAGIPSWVTPAAGTVTSVTGTASRISSTGGATPVIDIDAAYVGQASITILGTVGTGVWQGTVVGKAYGGTGVNILTTALALGTASSVAGQLTFQNATNAFTQTLRGTNPAASIIYDLPTTAPTAGQVLSASAPSGSVSTLSWVTASSGITVGTTTITSGTTRRIPYNLAGVYQEALNELYFELASPYAHVFAAGRTGIITGVNNSFYGYQSGKVNTSGANNAFFGFQSGVAVVGGSRNVSFGSLLRLRYSR